MIVDYQIKNHPENVAHSIRAILERIGADEDVRIRLSSDDHGIVQQLEAELKASTHKGRMSLDLDSGIKRGDCIVESNSGEIASFVDEKLEALRQELERMYPGIEAETKAKTGS